MTSPGTWNQIDCLDCFHGRPCRTAAAQGPIRRDDEPPVVVSELLKAHQFSEQTAGDGYTEPRELWAECSCGVTLYAWQQHYDEHDDRIPAVEYAAHIAWLAVERTAAFAAPKNETESP